jgi:hypothetical protein
LRQLHLQAITVHDPVHFLGRDEHAVLHPIYAQETVASTISADDAFNYAADMG